MVVLGIDPGYAIVGFGAIRFSNSVCRPVGFGAITTEASADFNTRLEVIYDEMRRIIEKYEPEVMAIEKLYFQNNQKTAILVAQARGVILLAARKFKIPTFEYTPLQVKTAVTGYGRAQKQQVMEMTRRLLNLAEVPTPDDTADALAVAICHTNSVGTETRMNMVKRGII